MGFRSLNITALKKTLRTLRSRTLIHQNHGNHSRIIKRWHVGHPDQDHGHVIGGGDDGVFKLGLSADIGLAFGKSITGYLSGSTAIIADAAHSLSDIVLSSVAWMSFRAGKAPKDKEHPYGHGKFETLGALGISCMLLVTSGGIAWHAIDVLQGLVTSNPDMIIHMREHSHNDHHSHGGHHHGIDLDHPVLALSMTAVSISVKEGLYWITKRAGEKEGSELMKANAWHHRTDVMSSIVALIGVATLIAVYANWGFARIKGIRWGLAGVIWLYSVVFFFPLDWFKFAIRYILSGKAWDNLLENKTAFSPKKDYGREEKEAQWAMAQRTLHGLQPPETTNLFADKNGYRELSEIDE